MRSVLKVGIVVLGVATGYLVAQLPISGVAHAQEDFDMQGVLAIAKIAGACGILDEMINYQKKTKLPGGDDFVYRFWLAESARQGKSVKQMSDTCNEVIESYNKFWTMADPKYSTP